MPNVLLTSFTGEGETDRRFLQPIIRRTLEQVLWDSPQQIDVYDPEWLGIGKGMEIVKRGERAQRGGSMLFVVHADADAADDIRALAERIEPVVAALWESGVKELPIVALIPVHETEAWLLADRDALRVALNTKLSNQDLDLHGDAERYADPKFKLQQVVNLANDGRGPHLGVPLGTLYDVVGEACDLLVLERLRSYQRFRIALTGGLQEIGFL